MFPKSDRNDGAAPSREDDVASFNVQLGELVIGFGPWWCIKVMLHHPLLTAGCFRGHGKTVRQSVQNQGQALDPISVCNLHVLFLISKFSLTQSSLFSMYQIQGLTLDLNIFVPRRNDSKRVGKGTH